MTSLLFVEIRGRVLALDHTTGAEVWHNQLKGLGRMLISIASSRTPSGSRAAAITERHQRATDAAIAAATTG